MIIDIPPQLEKVIIEQAQMQGISVSELIAKWSNAQYDNEMIDAVLDLEPSESFKSVNAVELQRELRNEWR